MREEAEHIELPRELAAIDTRTQSGGLWDLGEDLGRGAVGLTFVDNRLAQPAGFYSVQCPLVQYRYAASSRTLFHMVVERVERSRRERTGPAGP
jgi:hypothetical protein